MYRAIALDLDGTLLNSEKKVSEENLNVLEKVIGLGVEVILCSGRSSPCVDPIRQIISQRVYRPIHSVSYNGACARINDSVLFKLPVPRYVTELCANYADHNNLLLNVYHQDIILARVTTPSHQNFVSRYIELTSATYEMIGSYRELPEESLDSAYKILIFGEEDDIPELFRVTKELVKKDGNALAHVIQGDFFVEVLHPEVNKGRGLVEISKLLDLDLEHVIAFGDGYNDIEFIQNAGLGIAVKNGKGALKEVSDVVSEFTNEEHSVAEELLKLIRDGKISNIN